MVVQYKVLGPHHHEALYRPIPSDYVRHPNLELWQLIPRFRLQSLYFMCRQDHPACIQYRVQDTVFNGVVWFIVLDEDVF